MKTFLYYSVTNKEVVAIIATSVRDAVTILDEMLERTNTLANDYIFSGSIEYREGNLITVNTK